MPKIVNSWNEWDPLRRVIVGRPEGTNIAAPEPAWQYDLPRGGYPLGSYGPFPQEMVDAANEQMDYFVGQIEKLRQPDEGNHTIAQDESLAFLDTNNIAARNLHDPLD